MIKHWQSMDDYLCFLHNSKISFDSSERKRLHSELWEPWQKLRLFDTDKAMDFLLPFYSHTGRPAKNQPQLLRSFILFFLMLSMGLTPPSLTLWAKRLLNDRVLAALIGCAPHSIPPLGSYFDFMNRLWLYPDHGLYSRQKLLPASWNSKKPDKPKGKHQKAPESSEKITERIVNRLLNDKDILFNFEARLQLLFYHAAVIPSLQCGIIPSGPLTVSGDGTAVHTHACPRATTPKSSSHPFPRTNSPLPHVISLTPMPPGGGIAIWKSIISAILSSSFPATTLPFTRTCHLSSALPAPNAMIP